MEEEQSTQKSGGAGKTAAIVLLSLLLAGSLGSNYWLWTKEKAASSLAVSQVDSLSSLNTLKDSLYAQLNEEEIKVHNLRLEIAMYQSSNDSLQMLLEEKLAKIASLRAMVSSGGSPSKLRALKDSLNRLTVENTDFRTKIEEVLMQNEDYRLKMLTKDSLIAALNDKKDILSSQVEIASQPSVGPIIVTPVYMKKGVFVPQFKARKVESLKIQFDVLANKLTGKSVEKTYLVRIIDPDGIVLSTSNKQLSNSDDVYTLKEVITFDGTLKKINTKFTQEPSYKKGKYKVELKEGGEVIQSSDFSLM